MQTSQSVKPISESDNRFRFTLRTMFAFMWFSACVIAAIQSSFWALLFIGLPFGLIGFAIIDGRKWRSRNFILLGVLGCFGLFGQYVWPYMVCPIPLPASASRLQVSVSMVPIPTAWEDYVRFEAPVDDCIETAEKAVREVSRGELHPPEKVDKDDNVIKYGRDLEKKVHWFDVGAVKNGLLYKSTIYANYWVLVDTDRGILYFHSSD